MKGWIEVHVCGEPWLVQVKHITKVVPLTTLARNKTLIDTTDQSNISVDESYSTVKSYIMDAEVE